MIYATTINERISMKKALSLSLFAAALAVSAPAFAQSAKFEGFSVSAGLSMMGASTQLGGAISDPGESNDPPTPMSAAGSIDMGKNSTIGVLDVGYGIRVNPNFVLGVGGTLDLGKTKSGAVSISGDATPGFSGPLVQLIGKNHFSVYAQPTWLVTPDTGLFFKVGYHQMSRGQEGMLGSMLAESGGGSASMKLNGIGYGIGVKTYITKTIFVQAEAGTVSFKSKDLMSLLGTAAEDPTLGGLGGLSAKVKTTAGIVSIGMNF